MVLGTRVAGVSFGWGGGGGWSLSLCYLCGKKTLNFPPTFRKADLSLERVTHGQGRSNTRLPPPSQGRGGGCLAI